jgi:uncharacterized protein
MHLERIRCKMEAEQFESEAFLNALYAEVERRFERLDDLAHGWEHVDRVYRQALRIAQQEGASRVVVGAAALLHDLGRTAAHSPGEHHADLSVGLAREILADYALPAGVLEEIQHAIVGHSFSRGVEPRTLEARVVRDADRLDALGALGIMRWAVSGARRGSARTRNYHAGDPFAVRRDIDDGAYMLDHFYAKLLKLADDMGTRTGRALADRRTAYMRGYLAELEAELQV